MNNKMKWTVVALILLASSPARSAVPIALDGKAVAQIVLGEENSQAKFAARELAKTLEAITGAKIETVAPGQADAKSIIYLGRSKSAAEAFPNVDFDQLASEEILIESGEGKLLLAGGGERGNLYAVNRFLQERCGVRWWTPWASEIPKNPNLSIGQVNTRYRPPFELREPFWMPAFNPLWAERNTCNGQSAHIPEEMGGCIHYKGFVHTFYPMVPPEKYFKEHPEWYSLINGKRTHDHAQLCLTNPKLRAFMVQRVKEALRESPDARIISISQNDWYGACQCDACKAVDEREGSHSGTMLEFANYIGAHIEEEFPSVAVDTLAYQYTRKPPKTIRPRKNVIVRLCSIECNFREPLDSPANAAFADDIKGWSAITDRLYVWDYTTDFAHYVQPHPNWFVLGPNIRFFAAHHVKGVFEQGAYQSHGSEMAEMRAWVLAQLLWNPRQDDRALIREFLRGYYGKEAAAPIYSYLELMHAAAAGHNLTCYSDVNAPFLNYEHLAPAEKLWAEAEAAVKDEPELLTRVRVAHLPLRYVWLRRWDELKKQSSASQVPWPLPDSRQAVAGEWKEVASGTPGKEWTKITRMNEGGLKPEDFLKSVSHD
jgi:hypothetical protein